MKFVYKIGMLLIVSILTNTLFAQEFIKEIYGMDDDHPIVREWGSYRVVSSSKIGHNSLSHFYLVQDNSSIVAIEEVNINMINDFVVSGDYVFFCGNTTHNNAQSGIMGYFNLNQFPNAPITYLTITECKTLSKIATFGYNSTSMRTFMTGIDTGDHSRVVEVLYTTYGGMMPGWRVYTTRVENLTGYQYFFDDLVLLDTTLVVAGRYMNPNTSQVARNGYLFYFGLNNVYPTPALSHCTRKDLGIGSIVEPLLLEKCSNNYFVVAEKNYTSSTNSYKVYLTSFNNYAYHSRMRFSPSGFDYVMKDMAFNADSNILDFLIFTGNYESIIYNFNPSMAFSSRTASGRLYQDYHLNSLCYLNSSPKHFIAAGVYFYSTGNTPDLAKYNYSIAGTCSDSLFLLTKTDSPSFENYQSTNTYTDTYYMDESMNPIVETKYQLIIRCTNKDN